MASDTRSWLTRMDERLAPSMAKDHPNLPVVQEEGCYYYGTDGQTYLDFTSGIAVTNTGHRHPKVVEAIKNGADRFTHGPSGVIMYDSILTLADKLAEIMPGKIDCFFFGNSGTEAVEGALKLAKYVTERPAVISFTGGFHGRTFGAMGVSTSKSKYRKHMQTQMNAYQLPYANPDLSAEENVKELNKELDTLFDHQITPEEVACMIVEPILGEGGYIVPPAAWLQALKDRCEKHEILLIFDEVQTGFGRTGEWFASQKFAVEPDILAAAKGIASGMPLGVTAASKELMQKWPLGAHATTFGGNPIACEAGIATIDVLQEEKLPENAEKVGRYAREELEKLKEKHPTLGTIRGTGLMIGIEIINPQTGAADGGGLMEVLDLALEEGVLFYFCGNKTEVMRMIPPLIVTEEQIDDGLEKLDRALTRFESTS
ncbi:aspartate aminotransferase family protein [Salisediminibacterium halotolerans]|uniref:4-aminobutyrate aminotransferase n=1 Tax=Salisediminibacterium halotolerans TaxID=517425 RepID=A0A1H9WBY6_9BACI|nr:MULTISPECIES: aspartate aminotransferase family protein [Salisediminibacterium]RLJ79346.1 4-aminobutyrate aminotransferase [Actinophytocola xinjiangensis]RPE83404.1 4-aminobutyrate aminotransferase [Salisediminibacterium halotolerans]TWG37788.1 4-aminobutyrate aminotransferase [Salisediminibacterium halotolerans]SES31462.1 4-aminobutyrate aminotransferase [Salisediminibacterium haloalkalitolerans]GEL09151.1 aspartate aminotransferase family protein [Salisediminibacterium halotolerans]